jgi:hypothetical protein
MVSWRKKLGQCVLAAAIVLVLATRVGAHERWTADVVVDLDAGGRPVLPDRDAARHRPSPSPRAVTGNALRFTFDSPGAPWSGPERDMLTRVLGDCYPVVRDIYGEPAFDHTVNVRRDPSLGFEGVYDPTHNEMRFRSAAQPDVVCHELMHAFRDDYVIGQSSFEEGMARAAEIELFDRLDAYEHSFDERHGYGYDVYYEGLDRAAIGGRGGSFFLGYASPLVRYQLAGYAWGKVLIENSGFFVDFNRALYAASAAAEGGVPEARLVEMAATVQPAVEGAPFTSWYGRQGVLDTNPPGGYFLYQRINQLIVDYVYRDASGLEIMQPNAPFAWRVYDDRDTVLDEGDGTTNGSGVGFIPALRMPDGYAGRLRVVASAVSPAGPIENVAYRPAGGEQGVFGVVIGSSSGTVTFSPLDDATLAVGARVERGAFSAPSLATVRGRFEATFAGDDGSIARRRFTKDASDYFVVLVAPDALPRCAPLGDADARIVVTTRPDGARLVARIALPLAGYDGEVIALGLEDGAAAVLASLDLGALVPVGRSQHLWQYRGRRTPVVRRVSLRNLGTGHPGWSELRVVVRGSFAAAASGGPVDTVFTVTVGSQCARHAVTRNPH